MFNRVFLILFLCSFIWTTESFATDRYVSEDGAGSENGTSESNAYSFDNGGSKGDGIEQAIQDICDGDGYGTVWLINEDGEWWELSNDNSDQENIIQPPCSGSGGDITIRTLGAIDNVKETWVRFLGTRSYPGMTDDSSIQGEKFLNLVTGISNIKLKQLRIYHVMHVYDMDNGQNDSIKGEQLYTNSIKTFLYISPPSCDTDSLNDYTCADEITNLDFDNIESLGVGKRWLRSESSSNGDFDNITIDGKDENGYYARHNYPNGIWLADASRGNTFSNITIKNMYWTEDFIYDNGDCVNSEFHSGQNDFDHILCVGASDSGFDMKGGPHNITDSVVIDTARAIRCWGRCTLDNVLIYLSDKSGLITSIVDKSPTALWGRGIIVASNITFVDNSRIYMWDGDNGGSDIEELDYDGGNGTAPQVGEIVSGSSASLRVLYVDGNGTSGTIYGDNDSGTFVNDETITTSGGFSGDANGANANTCGRIYVSDSIKYLSRGKTSYDITTTGLDECTISGKDGYVSETNVDSCIFGGACDQEPEFSNIGTDYTLSYDWFNSSYGASKGYYNSTGSPQTSHRIGIGVSIAR